MSLTDGQMFGPSSLGGGPPASHARPFTLDDLMGSTRAREQARGNPPFRIGDVVRQKSGPMKDRNQRAVVADIKYLTDGPYKGWAIKLESGGPPFAAEYFERFTETPTEDDDRMHDVRVVYSTDHRAYIVTIDGDRRFHIQRGDAESFNAATMREYLAYHVGNKPLLIAQVMDRLDGLIVFDVQSGRNNNDVYPDMHVDLRRMYQQEAAARGLPEGAFRGTQPIDHNQMLDHAGVRRAMEEGLHRTLGIPPGLVEVGPPEPAAPPEPPAPTLRRRIVRRNKK